MKVFISYSRLDASETAKGIHEYLKERGHQVFIDTFEFFVDEIKNRINQGDVTLENVTNVLSDKV